MTAGFWARNRKNILSAGLFLVLLALTFWAIFKNNDLSEVLEVIGDIHLLWLVPALGAAMFFIMAEGIEFWYLFRALGVRHPFWSCIWYAFVGFFYSSITPSATGGQPMQLYYMKKAGLKISDSAVVLMVVALVYKSVLVLIGLFMCLFFYDTIFDAMGNYGFIYWIGLGLNGICVSALLFIMLFPNLFRRIICFCERMIVRMHLIHPSVKRRKKLFHIADDYQQAVSFFYAHKRHVLGALLITIVQRVGLFMITWFVYRSMGFSQENVVTITVLQAVIYVAVDMLPLPGAQGITELIYQTVFASVFAGAALTASMCVTRFANFYVPMILSALLTLAGSFYVKHRSKHRIHAATIHHTERE